MEIVTRVGGEVVEEIVLVVVPGVDGGTLIIVCGEGRLDKLSKSSLSLSST